jgi:tRNA nucleotidyltransferase/poly(A) polymerase
VAWPSRLIRTGAYAAVLGSAPVETSLPNLNELPRELLEAARSVGGQLAERGHRSWIVGGAVRDLCMGRRPSDVDMATDATPDEVEALFPKVVPLGKRFGTVLVKTAGLGIEVTTLRDEGGYDDARRPDSVVFGTSVQVDASRRDFTCNAMYLDSQTGAFQDPAHGMADLAADRLVAVGDPKLRFQEDGLRIFRLARLAATLGLEPSDETLSGASSSLDSLRGVSGERMMAELTRGFASGEGLCMLRMLSSIGVHQRVFPEASANAPGDCVAVCGELADSPDLLMGLLTFVDPDPLGETTDGRMDRTEAALEGLALFRPSRELKAKFASTWRLCAILEASCLGVVEQGQLLLWMRDSCWSSAVDLALAAARARSADTSVLQRWRLEREALSDESLFPNPWIQPQHLAEVGLPKGPRWREALETSLRMQLGGELNSAEEAMAWLQRQLED